MGSAIFLKKYLTAIRGDEQSLGALDAANKIIIFGGAGAGIGLLLDKLDKILLEQDPGGAVEKFKINVEDLAFRVIEEAGAEPEEEKRITIKNPTTKIVNVSAALEDLVQVIAHNIAGSGSYLSENVKLESMLEFLGAGVALTEFPTTKIMLQRELEVKLLGKRNDA